jgi:hypothetical protein
VTRHRAIFLLTALVAALVARAAVAMTVLPLDLPELTAGAGTIFVGRVTRVDPGVDERGIPAVWTTFAVEETLKGAPRPTLTLKQLGAPLGASGTPSVARGYPSVPRFAPGESVMLFVHPPSALGFASPVGLGQGAFRIRDDGGRRVVTNDVGNRNLDARTSGAASARVRGLPSPEAGDVPSSDDLPLDTLLTRVRALVDATP